MKSICFGNFAKADKSYAVGETLLLNTEYLAATDPPRLARQVVPPALSITTKHASDSSIDQGRREAAAHDVTHKNGPRILNIF
jgi:hypothetical protein